MIILFHRIAVRHDLYARQQESLYFYYSQLRQPYTITPNLLSGFYIHQLVKSYILSYSCQIYIRTFRISSFCPGAKNKYLINIGEAPEYTTNIRYYCITKAVHNQNNVPISIRSFSSFNLLSSCFNKSEYSSYILRTISIASPSL